MSVSAKAKNALQIALADPAVGNEVAAACLTGSAGAAPVAVAVTFTSNTPATYGSPVGTLTVSDGSVPTVVELVKYCNELRGNIASIIAALHARGITL